MKIYSINHRNHVIEFRNSFWGKESVLVDGKIASERFSFSGSRHHFKLDTTEGMEDMIAEFRMGAFVPMVDLMSNGKPVIIMPRISIWRFFLMGVVFVFIVKLLEKLTNSDII